MRHIFKNQSQSLTDRDTSTCLAPRALRLTLLGTIILLPAAGCQRAPASSAPPASVVAAARNTLLDKPPQTEPPSPILFTDVTPQTNITWRQVSGTTNEKHYPTANGSGVAMFDFDRDGWMDLYVVTSQFLRDESPTRRPANALYRNRRDGSFEDVTAGSGLGYAGFGQGVAVGDVNNDGFLDVYLPCYGGNVLRINNGDGSFRDASADSGTADLRWGVSAAFLDYDEDGNLDLYVANYGKWTVETNQFCGNEQRKIRMYCNPKSITPELHILYHNEGDGSFRDVTSAQGIQRPDGRGQGVVAADVNGDGHIDLYVANDLSPKFLFINDGRGGFLDKTDLSGAQYNTDGNVEASMGIDAGDVFGSGRCALFVTNFENEHNTLFENLGNDLFQDVSDSSGVAVGSVPLVGWGTALEDLDNDGWLDIFVANGNVDDNLAEFGRDSPYEQPARIWRNVGKGSFKLVAGGAGDYFRTVHASRGVAFGDLDNDGDVDVAICHKDAVPTVLRNDSAMREQSRQNNWIQFEFVGTVQNRDAVGTAVQVQIDRRVLHRQVRGGKSYASAHDLRLTIGTGDATATQWVSIRWPGGKVTRLEAPELRRAFQIREPPR